jgi:hypothetical protein
MKNCALKMTALLSGLVATGAFAQGETGSPAAKSGATFWIDHNVLVYSTDKTKPDQGSDIDENRLVTTPDDLTVGIFWKNYGIYVMPNNAGGAVGLSLFPDKEVEIGVLLGTDRQDNDDAGETKSDKLGVFGTYYMQLDAISTIEFSGRFLYGKSENEVTNAGVKTKRESKSNTFEIGAQYDYQIAEHFHVVPGIFFHTGSATEDNATGGEDDTDNTGFQINLAHFRYVF